MAAELHDDRVAIDDPDHPRRSRSGPSAGTFRRRWPCDGPAPPPSSRGPGDARNRHRGRARSRGPRGRGARSAPSIDTSTMDHDPTIPGPARRGLVAYHGGPVTTVLLVRHGLTALTNSTLVGWTPGISLDATGRAQVGDAGRATAADLAGRDRQLAARALPGDRRGDRHRTRAGAAVRARRAARRRPLRRLDRPDVQGAAARTAAGSRSTSIRRRSASRTARRSTRWAPGRWPRSATGTSASDRMPRTPSQSRRPDPGDAGRCAGDRLRRLSFGSAVGPASLERHPLRSGRGHGPPLERHRQRSDRPRPDEEEGAERPQPGRLTGARAVPAKMS